MANEIMANAALLDSKVLDMQWRFVGVHEQGDDPDLGPPPKPTGKIHIVSGQNLYWQDAEFAFVKPGYCDNVVTTYQHDRSCSYMFRQGSVFSLSINCKSPAQTSGLQILSDVTPCMVWTLGNVKQEPARFQEFIEASSYLADSGTSSDHVVTLRRHYLRAKDSRSSYERIMRFEEKYGRLVLSGTTENFQSVSKAEDGEEFYRITTAEKSYDYQQLQGVPIPKVLREVKVSRLTNLDGSPYKNYAPIQELDQTWTLLACRILDEFPVQLLNITVPPTAKIIDNCRSQAERVVQREARQSAWTRGHWLMVGVALCVLGSAMWCYRRFRR